MTFHHSVLLKNGYVVLSVGHVETTWMARVRATYTEVSDDLYPVEVITRIYTGNEIDFVHGGGFHHSTIVDQWEQVSTKPDATIRNLWSWLEAQLRVEVGIPYGE